MKEIKLTQGKITLVDDEDFEYLMQWKWITHRKKNTCYAVRHAPWSEDETHYKMIRMQRYNLRNCTFIENRYNQPAKGGTSRFKGVHFHKVNKNWIAAIMKDRKPHHIGSFRTQEEAALAYNIKAKEYFGEFAYLNNVESRGI